MMDTFPLEILPDARLGWPNLKRVEEFEKLSSGPIVATHRVVFLGKNEDFRIIRVQIDLPKYRLKNGRTISLQEQYLAEHPDERRDLFTFDSEAWKAQRAQHRVLLKVVKKANLSEYFEDTSKGLKEQVEPILLDESGFVVNGNRRLACWRHLLHKNPEKYSHFQHIDVVVLRHCGERDIDEIEANLQIEEDIKADYSWDAQANMIRDKMRQYDYDTGEIASFYKMKKKDVDKILKMREVATEYLKSRGETNRWSLVSDDEYAFSKIVTHREKILNLGAQEIFRAASFALVDKSEGSGRLYKAIPEIAENLPDVRKRLLKAFNVQPSAEDEELNSLLGGNPSNHETHDIPLAQEILKLENSAKAREIILNTIESCRHLKRDSKKASYLLDCCSEAYECLDDAVENGLRPESKREGVSERLDNIKALVDRIQKYLDEHAKPTH